MKILNYISGILVMLMTSLSAQAQTSGISSPYSRYGFGRLTDATIGASAAMGGVSQAVREGTQINIMNPASYSAVDSLTMLVEAGVSAQNMNIDNGKTKLNSKNASFDYVAFMFRAFKNVGMSFGMVPYSKIGYSFSQTQETVHSLYGDATPYTNYDGNGGLSQIYYGVGGKFLGCLSLGANISYLYGDLTHNITNGYTDTSIFNNIRVYDASISTYKLDLGIQFEQKIGQHDKLTLGASFTPGHGIGSPATRKTYLYDTNTQTIESITTDSIQNGYELPTSIAAGLSYQLGNKLKIAADYSLTKFGSVKSPMTVDGKFQSVEGLLADRQKISAGLEFCPNQYSRGYLKRIKYRLGGYYSTAYQKVSDTAKGKEYGLSAGFGFPIQNMINSRSVVNITGQWVHVDPGVTGLLKENYLRLCLSITFNERWFAKWKVE